MYVANMNVEAAVAGRDLGLGDDWWTPEQHAAMYETELKRLEEAGERFMDALDRLGVDNGVDGSEIPF